MQIRWSSCVAVLLGASRAAFAAAPAPAPVEGAVARFALIIGVNNSVDRDVAPLRYADDDAARYLDLFRLLGARSYLLARIDENTRRLHPQAAAEAELPTRSELTRALHQLALDLELARKRHVSTIVYFVYAGHGSVREHRGYLSLEDAHLGATDLETEVVNALGADETHFIVDACYSSYLVAGRGPGGSRREVHGFAELGSLATRSGVGLLFSTSSARESHEWAGVQAGVFSHEVRSGMLGAADADGDGQVTYREMVAFIERANASVPNERYRPDVYAHPASESGRFIDLRDGLGRRIDMKGADAAHYTIEDTHGVRLADFHNADGEALKLVRPAGQLYLRRVSDDREFLIPAAPGVVRVAELTATVANTQQRGAANDAYNALFELPFRREDVNRVELDAVRPHFDDIPQEGAPFAPWRTPVGLGLVGVGALSGLAGTAALLSAAQTRHGVNSASSQAEVASVNSTIATRNAESALAFTVAGAASIAGAVILLWPSSPAPISAEVSTTGATLRLVGVF